MGQLQIYFNTTNLTGQEFMYSLNKASSQNEKILMFFRKHRALSFTPNEVYREIFTEATPPSSIQRAMTTLTKLGYLIKTDKKVIGIYGSKVHKWKLK